ncbi:hypothetical protein [Nocardia sp. CC227C]|uniref:hypothetical protein n=1 Tax=Nocardia sp. CC227C TaxID=3044562 RepID=UPI00278C3C79|nr:hypothetical protein [Nocardia sp. CC227C]
MPDYSDLRALFIDRTLKRAPERGNTQGLVDLPAHIVDAHTPVLAGPIWLGDR